MGVNLALHRSFAGSAGERAWCTLAGPLPAAALCSAPAGLWCGGRAVQTALGFPLLPALSWTRKLGRLCFSGSTIRSHQGLLSNRSADTALKCRTKLSCCCLCFADKPLWQAVLAWLHGAGTRSCVTPAMLAELGPVALPFPFYLGENHSNGWLLDHSCIQV